MARKAYSEKVISAFLEHDKIIDIMIAKEMILNVVDEWERIYKCKDTEFMARG